MYFRIEGIEYIRGEKGPYKNVNNVYARYGRNSSYNYKEYVKAHPYEPQKPDGMHITACSLLGPSQDTFARRYSSGNNYGITDDNYAFIRRYQPEEIKKGHVADCALMGAAFEELGQKTEIPVEELNERHKYDFERINGKSVSYTYDASCMDLDRNGKVDLAEYATTILLADTLSTNEITFKIQNVTGEFTNKGLDAALLYNTKFNEDTARDTYQALYDYYNLNGAKNIFLADENNMAPTPDDYEKTSQD